MTQIDKVLYTGKTHTTGGRDGFARSSDGALDIKLSPPGKHQGRHQSRTALRRRLVRLLPRRAGHCRWQAQDPAARRTPQLTRKSISAWLGTVMACGRATNVSLPGIDPEVARALVEEAHQTCPLFEGHAGQYCGRVESCLTRRKIHGANHETLDHWHVDARDLCGALHP